MIPYFHVPALIFIVLFISGIFSYGCSENTKPGIDGDADTITDSEIDNENEPITCNGFEQLCDRSYSDVVYATTHNSMSNKDAHWVSPNQIHGIPQQLQDGIRGFMLDTHYDEENNNALSLCHGDCMFGKIDLVEALGYFKTFLDTNPNEVLTLITESYISADDTAGAFKDSGLDSYVFTPPEDMLHWPTLRQMIENHTNVVVFDHDGSDKYKWYLKQDKYCWETPWHNTSTDDFDCSVLRGNVDNDLLIINHFLYGAMDLASADLSKEANSNPLLINRRNKCKNETGQLPNFITVNHYSIGNIFDAVDTLNGVDK